MIKNNKDNIICDTDSYKASQPEQYQEGTEAYFGYVSARLAPRSVEPISETVFFGLQIFLREVLSKPFSQEDIDEAEEYFLEHGEPFPRAGFEHILNKYKGYMPVTIKAVPEGMIIPEGNVLATIECHDPACFWIAGWLETMFLRDIWYGSTVATNSRECKKVIMKYLELSSDNPLLEIMFKLHDFGSRGVSSRQSAEHGGAAHLVNFYGSDTCVGVRCANRNYAIKMAGHSIPACYDNKTEILTTKGFKLFGELTPDDKVAQYINNDKKEIITPKGLNLYAETDGRDNIGKINFVNPIKIYHEKYVGKMIRFYSLGKIAKVDLIVTPEHRMVRRNMDTGNIEIIAAKDVQFKLRNRWIQAGEISNPENSLSMLERLKIAFQADGSFPNRKDSYDGSLSGCKPIRFSLKKERKIGKLELIIKELGFEYSKQIDIRDESNFWIKVPKDISFSKMFDWIDIENISTKWCKEFIDEIADWDGTKPNELSVSYTTTEKYNAEAVQCIGILAGYRTTISTYSDKRGNRKILYDIISTKSKDSREGKGIQKEEIDYDGNIHCVEVPSGMIVVRRNGTVSISGNSEHSTITTWGPECEIDAFANMLRKFGTKGKVFACVSDSYNIFNACEHIWGEQLKQAVIDSGATLVIRPDSGNPSETILKCLKILDEKFGSAINKKGYKVLNYVRIIQGDGINIDSIKEICRKVVLAGFSMDNVNFGMGGALLQHLNRDTLRFAMKCSATRVNGEWRDASKSPIGDPSKKSMAGIISLYKIRDGHGVATKLVTLRKELSETAVPTVEEVLIPVYENGKLLNQSTFDEVRQRASL